MCILFVVRGLFAGTYEVFNVCVYCLLRRMFAGTYEVFNVCVYCLLREGCLLELMRFSMFVYIVC